MKRITFFMLFFFSIPAVKGHAAPATYQADAAAYVQTLKKLTDVMIFDVTGPCAAARYYAYANMAAYEVFYQQAQPGNYVPFKQVLRHYPDIVPLPENQPIAVSFASLYALLRMGEELLPSGHLLAAARTRLIRDAGKAYPLKKETLNASMAYADNIVRQLVAYAAQDGYLKTSGYLRYTPRKQAPNWQPTPPGYMEAYEPHWATLRPFLLDSAAQFKPMPAVPFSENTGTPFYALALEVHTITSNLSPEQKLIANFWDCNPFFLVQQGHVSYGTKKISPAGHWIGITGIACVQEKVSLAETIRWHTLVGLTMADAFISCWQEKYRSQRIRPETYINTRIDPAWRPLLQTPPFPEYTSGHSVVSASVALVLTALAGDDFPFTDTAEMEFGLPARTFTSFNQAAREAAVSRLYGGIHFRDAVENGLQQGRQIGAFVLRKLKVNQ
jgi:hypothetical protein